MFANSAAQYRRARDETSVFLEEVELAGTLDRAGSSEPLVAADAGRTRPAQGGDDSYESWLSSSGQKYSALDDSTYQRLLAQRRRSWGLAAATVTAAVAIVLLLWLTTRRPQFSPALLPDSAVCSQPGSHELIIQPMFYTIAITLLPSNFISNSIDALHTFEAVAEIDFQASSQFDAAECQAASLSLHSSDLVYTSIYLTVEGDMDSVCICGESAGCAACAACAEAVRPGTGGSKAGQVSISLGNTTVPPGARAKMQLTYTGQLSPNSGIYRSEAFSVEGAGEARESVLLVSQLEQRGARHVFPCVDEPHVKAPIALALIVPEGMTALSNMPGSEPAAVASSLGLQQITFAATPNMSTYLLAICVGHIAGLSTLSGSGANVTAWSVPALQGQLQLPLQIAAEALDFYAAWTGITQTLPKFDLAAVPGRGGAMENWGLLLFDEDRFLVNQSSEGSYGLWRAADVICHEVAHQWFGNLVTAATWQDITVNEGLASFMEYKCLEAVLPQLPPQALFQLAASPTGELAGVHEGPMQRAMSYGKGPVAQPLVPSAPHEPDSVVAYSFGASLFAMLESFWEALLPASFQAGLQQVLHKHAYGSIGASALLRELATPLQGVSNQDGVPTDAEQLANSLQTWLTTPAYPVITLSADNTTLRQQLFHSWTPHESDGSIGNLSSQQGNWTIPLHLSLLSSSQPDHWQLIAQAETVLPVDVAVSRTGETSDSGSNEGGDESEGDESEGNEGSDDDDLAAAQQRSRTVLLSKGGHGLHRTLYSNEQFAQLLLELQNGPAETAGDGADFGPLIDVSRLLQDAFELAFAGLSSPARPLQLAAVLAGSPWWDSGAADYLLGVPLMQGLQTFRILLDGNMDCLTVRSWDEPKIWLRAGLESFSAKLLGNATARILSVASGAKAGADPQSAFLGCLAKNALLREAALSGVQPAAGYLCGALSQPDAATWNTTQAPHRSLGDHLDPDMRSAVYAVAVAQPAGCMSQLGADAVASELLVVAQTDADLAESQRAALALGFAQDPAIIQAALDAAVEQNSSWRRPVTVGMLSSMLGNAARSSTGRQAAWAWWQQSWRRAVQKFGPRAVGALEHIQLAPTPAAEGELQALLADASAELGSTVQAMSWLQERMQHQALWHGDWEGSVCLYLQS